MVGPAISLSRLMKSFFETQIHYLEKIRDSGFDEEAVDQINESLQWVYDRDGEPVLLSRNSSFFGFYSERKFYQEAQRVFDIDQFENVNWNEILEEEEEHAQIEKPFLIIKASMPYGYYLEYLNKQKKKSYQI